MTHMVIRCETSKKDKNALTLSTMLRSPFLFICCVFFLAVLPVMQLVAFAARGTITLFCCCMLLRLRQCFLSQ